MNPVRYAIENRVVTATLVAVLIIAGFASYFSLPRSEDPGFTVRTAIVTAFLPGASPDRIERLVTDPLEQAVEEVEELDFMESVSRTGASVIQVNIRNEFTDMQPIWDDLRERVAAASASLPAGSVGPFVDDDFGDVFPVIVMMEARGTELRDVEDLAETVRSELLLDRHVARVEIIGVPEQRVWVEYDDARLARLGLTPDWVAEQLRARNILLAGGSVRTSDVELTLETSGDFATLQEVRNVPLRLPNGEMLRLRDVAEIRRGYEEPLTRHVSSDGFPAVALAVSMNETGKVSELGRDVLETIEVAEASMPSVAFSTVSFRPAIVDGNVSAFTDSLLQGIVAVLLVVLVALGMRTGLIVASIVPVTMVGSLLIMSAFSISLNKISLAGLILSLGLLVDCAVVIVESMVVRMREGEKPADAAISSVKELAYPLFVGAGTTSLALLPTYIAEHQVAEYTSAIFEVVTISLLLSWIVALTVLPMLGVRFLSNFYRGEGKITTASGAEANSSEGEYDTRFYAWYRSALARLMRNRWRTLGVAGAALVLAAIGFRAVPQEFIPGKEEGLFRATIELPYGTPFAKTQRVVADLEGFMRDSLQVDAGVEEARVRLVPSSFDRRFESEGILNWAAFVGSGAPRYNLGYAPEQPRSNYAYLLLNATSYEVQGRLIPEMTRYLEALHPDAVIRIERLRNGPPIDYPVEIRISGGDISTLRTLAEDTKRRLASIEGVVNVTDDWGRQVPKLRVEVDSDRASLAGTTNGAVARSLQTSLSGAPVGEFRDGEDVIPIVLRGLQSEEAPLSALADRPVLGPHGGSALPISQVAELELEFEPGRILRYDRQRTFTVQADLDPGAGRNVTAFSVSEEMEGWLTEQSEGWPLGYRWEIGGEPETSGQAQGAIRSKLPFGLLLIVLLLVVEFNSIRKTGIVLGTLPFSLIGVVLGLGLTQMPFGFMALLGVIALVGILINNAVVLLERIEIEIEEFGRDAWDAVIEASQRRLRPILLTTITTVGGLLPLWFGGDVMFQPMAVAMIFGLVVATLLTLGLVPVLYSLVYGVRPATD